MKYLRLIIKNAGRNKRRSILTVLSVAIAVFLLATMRSVTTTLDEMGKPTASESRLVVRRNTSLADAMPESYQGKLLQVPGVAAVCPTNWFGGIYKEDKPQYFIAQFYVDPKNIFEVHPEYQLPEEQKTAFQSERTAAMAGKKLADKFGWKIGDVIELKGTIYPVDPRLTLRAIFTATPQEEDVLFFHRAYVEEALGRPGWVGTYGILLNSPGDAPRVMDTVDQMFSSSSAPTKTETEAAFQASFVSMLGNVKGLITAIGLVVVFTISLIAANSMAMSARERFTEVAVMKALGFRPGVVLSLMLSESMLIAAVGGLIGAVGAKFVYSYAGLEAGGFPFLQNFRVSPLTVLFSIGLSLLIGLVSGGIPAFNAARIRIVDGLRRVA
jgi:putative ABC transport system permease protein